MIAGMGPWADGEFKLCHRIGHGLPICSAEIRLGRVKGAAFAGAARPAAGTFGAVLGQAPTHRVAKGLQTRSTVPTTSGDRPPRGSPGGLRTRDSERAAAVGRPPGRTAHARARALERSCTTTQSAYRVGKATTESVNSALGGAQAGALVVSDGAVGGDP
jgi:hypothetical protein